MKEPVAGLHSYLSFFLSKTGLKRRRWRHHLSVVKTHCQRIVVTLLRLLWVPVGGTENGTTLTATVGEKHDLLANQSTEGRRRTCATFTT